MLSVPHVMSKWVRLAGHPVSRLRACPEATRVTPGWRLASRASHRGPSQAGAGHRAAHRAVSGTGSWAAPFRGTSLGTFKASRARSRRGARPPPGHGSRALGRVWTVQGGLCPASL